MDKDIWIFRIEIAKELEINLSRPNKLKDLLLKAMPLLRESEIEVYEIKIKPHHNED